MCQRDGAKLETPVKPNNAAVTRRVGARYLLSAALAAAASLIASTRARAGYGKCSKCNCPAYEGNQNVCDNCGHNYSAHW